MTVIIGRCECEMAKKHEAWHEFIYIQKPDTIYKYKIWRHNEHEPSRVAFLNIAVIWIDIRNLYDSTEISGFLVEKGFLD